MWNWTSDWQYWVQGQFSQGWISQRFFKVKQPPPQNQNSRFPSEFDHRRFLTASFKKPDAYFMKHQTSNKSDSSRYRNTCHISGYGPINIPIKTSPWVWVCNATVKLCPRPKLCKTQLLLNNYFTRAAGYKESSDNTTTMLIWAVLNSNQTGA